MDEFSTQNAINNELLQTPIPQAFQPPISELSPINLDIEYDKLSDGGFSDDEPTPYDNNNRSYCRFCKVWVKTKYYNNGHKTTLKHLVNTK